MWTLDFAWSSGIFIDPFCSGRAKSRRGGVLAVDFDDFYRQHFFGFHAFGTILLRFLLTLTSSISFDAYLKLGSTSANLGRIGANPRPGRPAGLSLPHFAIKLRGEPLEPRVRSYQNGFCKFHKSRPKSLNQVRLSPNPMITRRIRAQFNLRSNMGQVINVSVRKRAWAEIRARPAGLEGI